METTETIETPAEETTEAETTMDTTAETPAMVDKDAL